MTQSTNKKDASTVFARLTETDENIFQAIIKAEGFTRSDALRYVIRFTGRAYGLLPTVDCPDCHSQQVEPTADDLLVCSECGQEFGR